MTADKNVFQLWDANGRKLPIKVRRMSWHYATYFLVDSVKIKQDYYEKTGKLYGDAYGSMFLIGTQTGKSMKLQCAGCYQWELVP